MLCRAVHEGWCSVSQEGRPELSILTRANRVSRGPRPNALRSLAPRRALALTTATRRALPSPKATRSAYLPTPASYKFVLGSGSVMNMGLTSIFSLPMGVSFRLSNRQKPFSLWTTKATSISLQRLTQLLAALEIKVCFTFLSFPRLDGIS